MKAADKNSRAGKIASCLIVALVVAGAVLIPAVANVEKSSGFMSMLFLGFLGAIVAVQVIPGMMLFGMMVKGLASLMRKETAGVKTRE